MSLASLQLNKGCRSRQLFKESQHSYWTGPRVETLHTYTLRLPPKTGLYPWAASTGGFCSALPKFFTHIGNRGVPSTTQKKSQAPSQLFWDSLAKFRGVWGNPARPCLQAPLPAGWRTTLQPQARHWEWKTCWEKRTRALCYGRMHIPRQHWAEHHDGWTKGAASIIEGCYYWGATRHNGLQFSNLQSKVSGPSFRVDSLDTDTFTGSEKAH